MEFKRCKKCVQLSTRPGIKFNEEGICYPCLNFEKRKEIDWSKRWNELEQLCNLFRRKDGQYDCLITVSGGKDSTFQVGLMKETLNMNPLCLMIDNATWTKTGRMNFNNLSERFGVDIINFTPNRKRLTELTRKGFLEDCHPEKYWDNILYDKPMEIAQKFGIELVIWGEDTSYFTGGEDWKETPNALKQSSQEARKKYWNLNVIFLSYYMPWSRYDNVRYAKENGFKGLDDTGEWSREGLEGFDYEQVDTIGYLVNQYCKFIVFGFSSQTELCSDAVRYDKMTREEALENVRLYDWKLDPYMLWDFCEGLDITRDEFWKTIDKFANKKLLYKDEDGFWKLKKEYLT